MVFDPLSWATSFFLNTAGKSILEKHFKDLATELTNTVNSWESGLPDELHFNIEALFSHVRTGEDIENFSARAELSNTFNQSHVPSQNVWFNALFERWSYVRENIENAHPFFLQPQDEAEKYLRLLSNQLEQVCAKNKNLFQVTVIDSLANISELVRNTSQEITQKKLGEIDIINGLDNQLINELAVAGYVNEASGIRRAIYLDKDQLYVHREKAENLILDKANVFTDDSNDENLWLSIVGDAGQGKSSLIWYLFNHFKQDGHEVYCILAQLSGTEILDRLDEAYLHLQKRSIIILDTLDLIVGVDNSRLATIMNGIRRAGHLLITTCRRQEIRSIPLKSDIEIVLDLYSDKEALQAINNYIRTFYPKLSEHERKVQFDNIWNILDAQRKIQELDLDPLILSMIFQTYIPNKIPQDINTQKIYSQFWQTRVLDDRKPSEDEKRIRVNLCLILARCIVFSHEGTDSFDIDDLAGEWNKKRNTQFPNDILDRLVSSGILHWARGRTHVRFFHQTFLEYTAAMDIRHAGHSQREEFLSELYAELKDNIPRRNPILKQIAVQDFFENGHLCGNILESLEKIHTLFSLQIALEILGKIGSDSGRTQRLCHTWIAEEPSQVATTVRETIKHYPKSKIPVALDLLEPCLQTHEEIAIYTACSDKLALMDAESVYSFLRKRLPDVAINSDGPFIDDRRSRIREALVSVFACGVNNALEDLIQLFPTLKSGQRAGLLSSLSGTITSDNSVHIQSFCMKLIDAVIEAEEGEVRFSFLSLLDSLQKFAKKEVEELCQSIYDSGRWKANHKAATFTGSLIGRFLIDIEKIRHFLPNLSSPDPHLRLLCTWAIREAKPDHHEQILGEIIKMARPDLSENSIQMVFKVVGSLRSASGTTVHRFLQAYPWPSAVMLPDEFRQIWSLLAENDDQALKQWLWLQIEKATGVRYRQLFLGLLVLISKKISVFSVDELRLVYKMACKDEVVTMEFADIAGLIVSRDPTLAREVLSDFLIYQKQNIRTAAVRSLALSVNDHLEFTLALGSSILAMTGKVDRYSLLHCYLTVLHGYSGDNSIDLVHKFDTWFNEGYLSSLKDETAMVGVLMLLKIYAIDYPDLVFGIAQRCPTFTQGVAGALSAVYANVSVSLKDPRKLMLILEGLLEIIKTQQGRGHRRIRNSLRMSIPYLVRKLGAHAVFEVFFHRYKEITSPYALEDLVRSVVVVPEWSENESKRLLGDTDLPPQVKSIILSRAVNGL